MQAEDDLERSFYEKECIAQKWDVRTLRRQMNSALFLISAILQRKKICPTTIRPSESSSRTTKTIYW